MKVSSIFALIGVVAVIALVAYFANSESARWEKFVVANDCKAVTQSSDNASSSPSQNTIKKTDWLCNDGKVYRQ
ncbi:hypothetical protein N4P55_06920 [Pseudomonas fluorescens]|uniref:hypothetical protein n=1 Tax=Pseudomonas fluorescens TaxID=294 RepID=UPI0021D2E096|nr:hypothetical protein [Pseudomonas fluorescens]UXV21083.1 hypothetical protein N4P55_06920 [Pseudomonas fluorescens]